MVRDYLTKNNFKFTEEFYGTCFLFLTNLDEKYVDFAIEDKKVIIEVNGPTHYICPTKELN